MEALGPILLLVSVPLMLRLIPPNHIYGLRSPATLRDKSVWYDANALSGRHLFVLGLLMIALEFVVPASIRLWTLRLVGGIGFVGIMIADWRTANRWARERKGGYIEGYARPVEPHRIGRESS